jgi:transposase-like protein
MRRVYNPDQLELFGPNPNIPKVSSAKRRKKPAETRPQAAAKPSPQSDARPIVKVKTAPPPSHLRPFDFGTADLPKTIPVRLSERLPEPTADATPAMPAGTGFFELSPAERRTLKERVQTMASERISPEHCARQLGLDEELVAYWYHLVALGRMSEFIDWGRLIPDYTPQMEEQARRLIARGLASRQIELMLGIPHNVVEQWRKMP